MTTTETKRIVVRRGTATEWATANPVLGAGEIGYETDTGVLKVGDGTTPWLTLTALATLDSSNRLAQSVDASRVLNPPWLNPGGIVNALDYGAKGDGTTDDTAGIQAAIAACVAFGGGTVYFPAGTYLVSGTLLISSNNVHLVGDGGGFDENGTTDLRAAAATRILYAGAVGSPLVSFTSPAGGVPKVGGGVARMMLDGNNTASRCLEVQTWRGADFCDLVLFAATAEMLYTGCITGALTQSPYDMTHSRFENVYTTARAQTGNTAHAARLTGGQGNGGTAQGNTCFNTFVNCLFHCNDADALVLENADNNYFYGCAAKPDTGTGWGVVLCSGDQDSSPLAEPARNNAFFGGEYNGAGVWARASQTGGLSSVDNHLYGLNYSNGAPFPVLETPAGGSTAPTLRVYSSKGVERLNAHSAVFVNNPANFDTARSHVGAESIRVLNTSSAHMLLESTSGATTWGINIDDATGNLRLLRSKGSGGVAITGALGAFGATPVGRQPNPGTATGTDAAVLNNVVAVLRAYGLVT